MLGAENVCLVWYCGNSEIIEDALDKSYVKIAGAWCLCNWVFLQKKKDFLDEKTHLISISCLVGVL